MPKCSSQERGGAAVCVCASLARIRTPNARGTFSASDAPLRRELVHHLMALGYAPQKEAGLQEARWLIARGEVLDRTRLDAKS